jgi:type II secretory pathway pseudopilin PulG
MAALLVALAVMAVLLTAAMPVWRTAAKREKEAELVWRAGQYVRAIALFRRKYANASPPNLDILLNEKFLRKKYKDPITNDDFQLVYAADQLQLAPGQGGQGGQGGPGGPQGGQQAQPRQGGQGGAAMLGGSDSQSRITAGARGGIIGVVSKSKETGLRVFNGRTKYNEWAFTPETLGLRMPGAGNNPNAPGMNPPGGAAGTVGPGGRPIGGSRGQINLDRSRPSTNQPSPPRPFGSSPPPR